MIKDLGNKKTEIHESCFIAESADVIGKVKIGKNSSVWYKVVIRGDGNYIEIGENTNIQDNTVVHIDSEKYPTIIGDNVTVGHSAIVHACKVGNNALIGMGAIILDGSEIGDNTIIGAGSLVPPGKKIPSGVLAMGSPVKVVRELTEDEKNGLKKSAEEYVKYGKEHKNNQ
ncbi:carbonic anhydrase/acetyltransferase, isoleucine patch superfamily [Alkaliphilus metalliredigens QYMF]|uniref:Carbonic anhydrase/acetyltransferase, isoleucine patch superfamily n=1 Tax=Alkaliphilus metalliredigens (strain QYMF) TaxID=293826 RepID=A6TQN3_ALKMQ|nr:gamma carbonic anhydrase family protein [Alkaliphilus metalliredigens]ABR48501.1 carbonic anhydrase/acetyltransferase, isoleucine patch superfamily [Alkaliphilus metalliredigens QYMF]